MNRIQTLFKETKENILSVYFTAGYPSLNDTIRIIKELVTNNVDMIEIGIPFSDPVADGPVIQASSSRALQNGISVKLIFEQLADVRKITKVPLLLMGYLNPVIQYGMERFLKKCLETGIDGLILPDLPVDEYLENYKDEFEKHDILNIFLVTPQTPDERILYLDSLTRGFLYVVSTSATTGMIGKFGDEQLSYFGRIESLNLRSPKLIGFGVSNHENYTQACRYSNGAIAGSAFIKALEKEGSLAEKVNQFILQMRGVQK